MRELLSLAFLSSCLCTATALTAQNEVVHYKFDAADATQVLNFADGAQAAPRFGSLWAALEPYTDGVAGNALHSSPYGGVSGNRIDTGWLGGHTGSLTIAFSLRNRLANSSYAYSPFAGQPSWSIATGGSAGSGLQLRGWGGADLNVNFSSPLCSLPGWNHFAIVIDAQVGTATWYLDGAVASTTNIATGASIAVQSQLLVGTDYVTSCGSLYDIDEFRLLLRPAAAAEIASWAAHAPADAVPFGSATAVTLNGIGAPTLGNHAFGVQLHGPGNSLFALAGGFSYANYQGHDLPLDAATLFPVPAGSVLLVAPQAASFGLFAENGEATLSLPIPSAPALRGAALYLQGIALTGNTDPAFGSALAVSVGN